MCNLPWFVGCFWVSGVKAFLEQENAKMGGRVQWSYKRHTVRSTTHNSGDGYIIYNRLDVSWQAVAAPVIMQSMERGAGGNLQIPTSVPVAAPEVLDMTRGGGGATVVPEGVVQKPKKTPREQLSELKGLLDDGLISEEEFASSKAKVLEAM